MSSKVCSFEKRIPFRGLQAGGYLAYVYGTGGNRRLEEGTVVGL